MFFQRCKESTEFHFDDIDYQLKVIEDDFVRSAPGDAIPIREGDFFITRHSNLPLVHIVFHLVIDFECKTSLLYWFLIFIDLLHY